MKLSLSRIAALIAFGLMFAFGNNVFAGHEDEFKFTGIIESLPNTAGFVGDWRVAGRTVHVTSATRIEQEDGRVAVGATVKVEGTTRSDNSFDAAEIDVKQGATGADDDDAQPTFKGTIETLSNAPGFVGDWRVGGRIIHVTAATRIETEFGPIAIGAFVEIHGTVRGRWFDGRFQGRDEIEYRRWRWAR
jgi:DNA-binding transcriptional regulator of glucitol operon